MLELTGPDAPHELSGTTASFQPCFIWGPGTQTSVCRHQRPGPCSRSHGNCLPAHQRNREIVGGWGREGRLFFKGQTVTKEQGAKTKGSDGVASERGVACSLPGLQLLWPRHLVVISPLPIEHTGPARLPLRPARRSGSVGPRRPVLLLGAPEGPLRGQGRCRSA